MRVRPGAVLSLLLAPLCISGAGAPTAPTEQTIRFGRFGTVFLYSRSASPSDVVLFVSGDGGWNLGVVDMAKALSTLDALVVGIDITKYLKALEASPEKCSYPAADFEALSQFIQKRLDRPRYSPPVLCGYSSGATLVYAVLVQAPPGTFKGGISMGFCPDLQAPKPFCRGYGLESTLGSHGKGQTFAPASSLETPWVAFQGVVDQVCDRAETEKYVKQVGHAEIVELQGVGHGFSVEKNWMPQLKRSFEHLAHGAVLDPTLGAAETRAADAARGEAGAAGAAPGEPEPKGLPLVEVPAKGGPGDTLALLELLRQQRPEWSPSDQPVCADCLHKARIEYVQEALQKEKGEISDLEAAVIRSLREQDLLSQNINAEFDEKLTLGERVADLVASFGGSWTFIMAFGAFFVLWMAINSIALLRHPFDPFPYILLNLLLSCLAAIQAPVIMMSQNRQDARDRLRAEHDYRINMKAELEIRHLHSKLDQLLSKQWHRLMEIQKLQVDLMEEIVSCNPPDRRS